jgi:hypothetical protein
MLDSGLVQEFAMNRKKKAQSDGIRVSNQVGTIEDPAGAADPFVEILRSARKARARKQRVAKEIDNAQVPKSSN